MNSFSLLTTPWLPVRLKDGSTGKLAPVNLADENVVDMPPRGRIYRARPGNFCWVYCSAVWRRKTFSLGRCLG
jgi:hypothetical protein